MITRPMDVLEHYEVRKTKKQKTAFLTAAMAYAASRRYTAKIEGGSFGCRNLVIGDAEKADYVLTAHYDTCPWLPLPNFVTPFSIPLYVLYQLFLTLALLALAFLPGIVARALAPQSLWSDLVAFIGYWLVLLLVIAGPANRHTANDNTSGVVTLLEIMDSLPENCRHKVCFVLFDLEEAGMLGSAAYRKAHRAATNRQILVNMDCVGDGDEIVLIPNKALRKDENFLRRLQTIAGTWGRKSIRVHRKGAVVYPSDQMLFPKGVAVAAFRRKRFIGPYYGRIHTHRDQILDHTNVNVLRAALISLIADPKPYI